MKYDIIKQRMDSIAHFESEERGLREFRVTAYGDTYNVLIGQMNPNKLTQVFVFRACDMDMKKMEYLGSEFVRWNDKWSSSKFTLQVISIFLNKRFPNFKIDVIHKCITVALIEIDDKIAIHAMYDPTGESELSFVPVCKHTEESVSWEFIQENY